ncbi:MAG: hypothetical protein D6747_05590 [Chlorobiota bacterium]|nr:MAG: hypothetical protein D6747_05590 [Chlorobiota bacterium]
MGVVFKIHSSVPIQTVPNYAVRAHFGIMMRTVPPNPSADVAAERASLVHPITYYEQLADAGGLYDFLQTTMRERFEHDTSFRYQMLRILLQRSNVVLPEVECVLLAELRDALAVFLSTVEQCHKQAASL